MDKKIPLLLSGVVLLSAVLLIERLGRDRGTVADASGLPTQWSEIAEAPITTDLAEPEDGARISNQGKAPALKVAMPDVIARLPGDESPPRSAHLIPALAKCLKDPELNPEGKKCMDEATRLFLTTHIEEANSMILASEEKKHDHVEAYLGEKLKQGLDPIDQVPKHMKKQVVLTLVQHQIQDGVRRDGSTVLYRGENPDLEAIIDEPRQIAMDARKKLQSLIHERCRD